MFRGSAPSRDKSTSFSLHLKEVQTSPHTPHQHTHVHTHCVCLQLLRASVSSPVKQGSSNPPHGVEEYQGEAQGRVLRKCNTFPPASTPTCHSFLTSCALRSCPLGPTEDQPLLPWETADPSHQQDPERGSASAPDSKEASQQTQLFSTTSPALGLQASLCAA